MFYINKGFTISMKIMLCSMEGKVACGSNKFKKGCSNKKYYHDWGEIYLGIGMLVAVGCPMYDPEIYWQRSGYWLKATRE
jgi:hypothetical protein